jgi:hypothetical protein
MSDVGVAPRNICHGRDFFVSGPPPILILMIHTSRQIEYMRQPDFVLLAARWVAATGRDSSRAAEQHVVQKL